MGPTIVATFGAGLILFVTLLAANVSRLRIRKRIIDGDGGDGDLHRAIRAHGNALEHSVPFIVLLLLGLQASVPGPWLLGYAVAFGVARVMHAHGFYARRFRFRQLGAGLSYLALIGIAVHVLTGAASG